MTEVKVEYKDEVCAVSYGEYLVFAPKPVGEAVEKLIVEHAQLKKENEELKIKIRQTWGEP